VRVVSLLPAATEIVAALGAGDWLVGVSHECDYPPAVQALPRVTRSTLDPALSSGEIDRQMAAAQAAGTSPITIDTALLRRLAPDVILGQSVCGVCAVGENALAQALGQLDAHPTVVTLHAHDLEGVLGDIQRVGDALDLASEAEELVLGMRYRFHTVSNRAPRTAHPRVLVLEWLDPPYVAGHWVPELVAIAGGADVGNRPSVRSVARPWPELRALAPERVVIALCGFDVARARREAGAVTDTDGRALVQDDAAFIDGNAYTSRPGPRLADAAELLARLMAG
jgi:iron complex transport system substrate-binding protein